MRNQAVLVNLRYLLREKSRASVVIVNSGGAHIDDGDVPVTLMQQCLGVDLRLRIGPGSTDRRLLADALLRSGGRLMDQHRAGEDELLDFERLESVHQPPGALDGYLVVERIGIAGNVIIGGEVNHRSDAVAVARADLVERSSHRFIRPDVDVDRQGGWWWIGRTGAIEADDSVAFAEPGDQGRSDETARPRDQNDAAVTLAAAGITAFDIGHDLLPSFVHLSIHQQTQQR